MTTDVDDRLKRELGTAGRRTRDTDDRQVTQSRELTEDDRLEMFRAQLFNDALPNLPEIPGYHVCWLTTTNPRDPIHRRVQLGYEPVKASEVPGMEYASVKTGEWAGLIGVNEMVAFKLPLGLYQRFMREAHLDAPQREESKLADVARTIRDQARQRGADVDFGDGTDELLRSSTPRNVIFD